MPQKKNPSRQKKSIHKYPPSLRGHRFGAHRPQACTCCWTSTSCPAVVAPLLLLFSIVPPPVVEMSVFSGFLSLSSSLKKIFVMTMSPVLSVWQDASRVSALGAGGGVVPCCSRDDSFDEPPELAPVTDVELDLDDRLQNRGKVELLVFGSG